MRVIEPPRDQHFQLRQPLTAGELRLLDMLDDKLPPEWEIYLQPHLNGLKPDFVLLNPNVGIGVIEVKDWDLDAMSYWVKEHKTRKKELYATGVDGQSFRVENPFEKIRRYKEEIYAVYCPRLMEKNGFGSINGALAFTAADRRRVMELQKPFLRPNEFERREEFWPIIGRHELDEGDVKTLLPLFTREGKSYMRPDLAEDLRGWLVEPDFSQTQRNPLEMDPKQRDLAHSRTKGGYRRLKGAAGSGKSLVLAAKAAKLVDDGKDVMVVTFNMTLWHYLRDLVVRARKGGKKRGTLTFTHFHRWCGDVCHINNSFSDEYAEIMQPVAQIKSLKLPGREEQKRLRPILPAILDVKVPELAMRAAKALPHEDKYDALLVDEGQDYRPLWWNALRSGLREGGEALLVADTSQDLYGSAQSWTEAAMKGAGFSGEWATLEISYRLPPKLLTLTQDFARTFLPEATRIIPQPENTEFDLYPCELRWMQCDEPEAVNICVNSVLDLMKKTGLESGLANSDIVFLTESHEVGLQIVEELEREPYGISCTHTFGDSKLEQDRRKMAFFLGQPRVKAATLHSFKGWESRMLVLHLSKAIGPEDLAGVYAAITRLKRDVRGSYITVVCSASQLQDYGKTWPIFENKSCSYEVLE